VLAIEIMMVFHAPVRWKYGGGTARNVPLVLRGMFMRGIGNTAGGGVLPPLKHII